MKICLFNFSKIRSSNSFKLSDFNSFKFNFLNKKSDIQNIKYKNAQKKKQGDHYIKKININIPSSEKLREEKFKNDFLSDYDSSFANFCEISKDMFTEIYIKNQYIPTLDELGDINISLGNISTQLNNFSDSKLLKIIRKIRNPKLKKGSKNGNKSSLVNKRFKIISNIDINNKVDNIIPLDEMNNKVRIKKKIKIKKFKNVSSKKNINEKNTSFNIFNNIKENEPKDKSLLNIKRKLKNIQIPKKSEVSTDIKFPIDFISTREIEHQFTGNNPESNMPNDIKNNNFIFSNVNNISDNGNLNKEINAGIANLNEDNNNNKSSNINDFKFSANSKGNNIFNFSTNLINESNNLFKMNTPVYTPYNNTSLYDNNNLLSPMFLSPERNYSMLSKNFFINTPSNINNVFDEAFKFRDNNGNDTNNDNDINENKDK